MFLYQTSAGNRVYVGITQGNGFIVVAWALMQRAMVGQVDPSQYNNPSFWQDVKAVFPRVSMITLRPQIPMKWKIVTATEK